MNKKILLSLRFVLIFATIMVLNYSHNGLNVLSPGYTLALIYLLSNLILFFIPEKTLNRNIASFSIFLFDILTISLAIYFSQGAQTDLYLVYFLVIFMASVGQNMNGSIPIAIVACLIYGWIIYRANPGISLLDSRILIRIPFLFMIALFSSYWSQSTRRELKKKEELERFNRELEKEVARVVAEEIELRQYSEKIINCVSSGVIAIRDDGVITTLNPEALRVFDLTTDAVGFNINQYEFLFPLWEKMQATVASQSTVARDEITLKIQSREVPIGFSLSPISGATGRFSGCVAIFKDLSEIRALEQQLKHAEQLGYIGKMASWVAHEIRNPLTAIDGFAQLLETTVDHDKIMKYSSEIHKGSQRISYIIEDILAFARTKRKIEYMEVDLKKIIESIAKSMPNIKINVSGILSPVCQGESESLRRIFINLISNSAEAIDENGQIWIDFKEAEGHIITEIRDNGSGISDEDLKKMFTPFFTRKQRGTGLGLSIVIKILKEHGGRIEIDSKKGLGTTCRVFIPTNATRETVNNKKEEM
ncbi:hypothetical protein A2Y85_01410 [candidate division WOR-3 bacterium RBG_13_43_14]|uniref:histidine kinase n=1 Tax=candidate division WOR-3 bacterium RBG_13_43_14 TaxID=1802590 RepID=A0A1F4U6U1_UNCW3|nr:MAG: hypothetical protein A2Y85_01410 [candidate division WOR-3 bacterium RBG_13_43_14]